MIHLLLLLSLVSGAADRAAPSRPRTSPKAKPAPKPPPPPVEEDPDENTYPDAPEPEDEPEIAPKSGFPKDSADPFPSRSGKPEFTDEQYEMIGAATLCTCFCMAAGIIGLIVFLVRRSGPKPAAGAAASGQPATAAPVRAIPFHLSVLAVGMRAAARQQVAQQLILAGVQADPVSAAERTQLVRELSKAVRGLESEWTHFGYGERLDLPDEPAAQNSYQLAVDDFSKRSADASLSGESTYVVLTLVMCTRRQLRGVSALDDRSEIRALLEDRAALLEADLMGAYIAWSAPIGGHEVLTRFPEMHAVR